jgi:hypothetical protein
MKPLETHPIDSAPSLPWTDEGERPSNIRIIFRADAIQRYLRGTDASTAPGTASSRTMPLLWLLLFLLLGSGLGIAFVLESTYTRG